MRISDWSSDVCSSDLLENDTLEDIGGVDLVFDVIAGDIQKRSAGLVRAGGTLVSIVGPAEARPVDGLALDFFVVPGPARRSEIARPVPDGRLRTHLGHPSPHHHPVPARTPPRRITGTPDTHVSPR